MEEGWEFIWHANKPPYVKLPNGRSIECLLKGNVPYLPDTIPAQIDDCAPAEDADPIVDPDPPIDADNADDDDGPPRNAQRPTQGHP